MTMTNFQARMYQQYQTTKYITGTITYIENFYNMVYPEPSYAQIQSLYFQLGYNRDLYLDSGPYPSFPLFDAYEDLIMLVEDYSAVKKIGTTLLNPSIFEHDVTIYKIAQCMVITVPNAISSASLALIIYQCFDSKDVVPNLTVPTLTSYIATTISSDITGATTLSTIKAALITASQAITSTSLATDIQAVITSAITISSNDQANLLTDITNNLLWGGFASSTSAIGASNIDVIVDVNGASVENTLSAVSLAIDGKIGTTTNYYHSASGYSHTFYACASSADTSPTLLYTTAPDISSFLAADNACAKWVFAGGSFYGSFSTDCSASTLLASADAYIMCKAGMDYHA